MALTLHNQIIGQIKSYRHAWAKVVASAPGLEAAVAQTPEADDTIVAQLLRSLLAAAPSANFAGTKSAQRIAFEAQLAASARQLARADGQSEPVTLAGLRARRAAALASTTLSAGAKRVAAAVTLPASEPGEPFADALAAVKLFFGV
jgi:hypothetical protein